MDTIKIQDDGVTPINKLPITKTSETSLGDLDAIDSQIANQQGFLDDANKAQAVEQKKMDDLQSLRADIVAQLDTLPARISSVKI